MCDNNSHWYLIQKLLGKMAIPEELKVLKDEVAASYLLFEAKVPGTVAFYATDLEAGVSSGLPSEIKLKWDEDLKALVWNIFCLELEVAKLDNELRYCFLVNSFLVASKRQTEHITTAHRSLANKVFAWQSIPKYYLLL